MSLALFRAAALAAAAAVPAVKTAPHRRGVPSPHSYKMTRSSGVASVDYNAGEITAGFTDQIKSVVIYAEDVSTPVAPSFGYTADTVRAGERLPRGVAVVRYKAKDYAEAAAPPRPQWRRAGDIEVNGGSCILYATMEKPPAHFGFLYADGAGRRRKPFYYYFIYTTGPHDDFGNLAATERWVKTLRIRPPGLKGEPRGCLDFGANAL